MFLLVAARQQACCCWSDRLEDRRGEAKLGLRKADLKIVFMGEIPQAGKDGTESLHI